MATSDWLVIDLGGSIVAPPQGIDPLFLQRLSAFFRNYLGRSPTNRLAIVVGGGEIARCYQQALRQTVANPPAEQLDWLGIRATQINATLLHSLLSDCRPGELIRDYSRLPTDRQRRLLIGGCWKPGFSTDYDSVLLAKHLQVKTILCLSNLAQIYNADPHNDPQALPMTELSWRQYFAISGQQHWSPGLKTPFDPIATEFAHQNNMTLVFMDGRDIDNLNNFLNGQPAVKTIVSD